MNKILSLHPNGKKGVNINKEKYDIIKKAIIELLYSKELTFTLLNESIKKKLEKKPSEKG